ncbi:peptidase M23 [Mycolicibacterium chitae]|uniref:Secreted peptidase n=1 Tax=Mycolicibacterium chitae TaxID=1792 RepID=A0A3S5EIQ3_MYCCI|nr:M23 family metallopeptidase [Mycolicibacterium chitae]MCV7107841.1 M23 family metallopeptidase [Mycolicibacterium chitae]BBZ01303.1 peptidase M23 [Mycolicibacterium chitae]VEG50142.1 secreted peptidase [Mycolicibacterium chitae]
MAPRALSRLLPLSAALLTAATVAACGGSSPAPESETATPTVPPAVATPLVGSAVAEPIPVAATDGRTHLVYELLLTNTLSGNATLNSLTARAGDRNLLTLAGDNLKYWTRALGNNDVPTNVLAPGQSAIVWLDVVIDGGAAPPTDITHSVDLNVSKPFPGVVPPRLTQDVAPVTVSDAKPISIAPPLDGPNWLSANSCCDMTAHRMAVNPMNGQLWMSERFAIDYVQLTDDHRLFTGDPTKLASYAYFGTPIHAVGSGKVITVVDNLPEQVPSKTPVGLPLEQYGGNHVVQDLGDGKYAFYAHLKPGSITVKEGDELTAGQQIAEMGNSGNSDAPHLHFHVMDGPHPLASNGLPFVFDSFRLDQRVASLSGLDRLFTGQPAPLQPGFAVRDETEVTPLVLDIMNYAVAQ